MRLGKAIAVKRFVMLSIGWLCVSGEIGSYWPEIAASVAVRRKEAAHLAAWRRVSEAHAADKPRGADPRVPWDRFWHHVGNNDDQVFRQPADQ